MWVLADVIDTNLAAARYQMAISFGFHIIFAALGIGFPLITLIAHTRGLRRRDADALPTGLRPRNEPAPCIKKNYRIWFSQTRN